MAVLGIDLGTSNSLVGYYNGEGAALIPNVFGEYLTPSVISIDNDNKLLIGKAAKERLVSHPLSTFSVFKRTMGTSMHYSYQSYRFSSTDLSSLILKQLKQDAENFLKEECNEAIISVPAYFNNTQRQATIDAAKLAGLSVIKLISEPTAAALAHGVHEFADDSTIIVLDLGGGTFDVSILEMFDGVLQVLAIAGDNLLGGEDFTRLLVEDFLQKNALDTDSLSLKNLASIYDFCEQLKQKIDSQSLQKFQLFLDSVEYTYAITYNDFYMLCQPLLSKLRIPILTALNDAKITINGLSQVILMGGATKMTVIQEFLNLLFNQQTRIDLNPDETVAIGAVLATAMHMRHQNLEAMMMTDVCGFTLGVESSRRTKSGYKTGFFSSIIPRNSTIPTSREESFSPVDDLQRSIVFNVYQGESLYTKDNLYLGEVKTLLPRQGSDQEVSVRFTYDISGLLEVECTVIETGEKIVKILKNDSCSLSELEIATRMETLTKLKTHPRDMQEYQLLLARLHRLYQLSNASVQMYLIKEIENFEDALDSQDLLYIKKITPNYVKIADDVERILHNVFTVPPHSNLN